MRVIWAIIALLVGSAVAAWVVAGDRPSSDDAPSPETPSIVRPAVEPAASVRREDPLIAAVVPEDRSSSASSAPVVDASGTDPAPPVESTIVAPNLETADEPRDTILSAEPSPDFVEPASDTPIAITEASTDPIVPDEVVFAPPAVAPPDETPTAEPIASEPVVPTAPPAAGEGPIPAMIETREDGSLLLDERFVLRGKGTKESPYLVTWDQLISASETYMPKQGRKRLPERVTMLDGKWVEITGNISYPLLEDEPRELLMMLNPWDGCCIGVPPTPYDAVEVHLTGVVRDDRRFAATGSVKGRFKVDPYLAGEWLIGLYVMENAELTVVPGGGMGF